MQTRIKIAVEAMVERPEIRAAIEQQIGQLEQRVGSVRACGVTIKGFAPHRTGRFAVTLRLAVAQAPEIKVGPPPQDDPRYSDVTFAIGDTFRRAARRLRDQARSKQGRGKKAEGLTEKLASSELCSSAGDCAPAAVDPMAIVHRLARVRPEILVPTMVETAAAAATILADGAPRTSGAASDANIADVVASGAEPTARAEGAPKDEPMQPALAETAAEQAEPSALAETAVEQPRAADPEDTIVAERAAQELAAKELAAEELAAKQLAAEELAAKELAAKERAAQELAAEELAAKELAAKELAAKELAAKELAAQELAAQERAAEELAAQELAAQELAAQELAAQELAAKELAAKEAGEAALLDLSSAIALAEQRAKASPPAVRLPALTPLGFLAAMGNFVRTAAVLNLASTSMMHGYFARSAGMFNPMRPSTPAAGLAAKTSAATKP